MNDQVIKTSARLSGYSPLSVEQRRIIKSFIAEREKMNKNPGKLLKA